MLRKIGLAAVLAASTALTAATANAAFITGNFSAAGEVVLPTLPTNILLTPTLDLLDGFKISGSLGGAVGSPVSVTDINQLAPTGWTVTAGIYTFTISSALASAPSGAFAPGECSFDAGSGSEGCSQNFNMTLADRKSVV